MFHQIFFVGVVLVINVLARPLLSQEANWQSVREVRPETRVEVILQDGKRVSGRVASVSDTELALDDGRLFARGQIYRVQVREKVSRWRGAMWGSLTGFAVGFAIGASRAGYITDRNNPPATVRLGTGAGMGMLAAGIGAPIGALAGGHKYATVYRAEKQP